MKFKFREDGDTLDWHRWFAWYPVRVRKGDVRWLEFVARRGKFHRSYRSAFWDWEYGAIK